MIDYALQPYPWQFTRDEMLRRWQTLPIPKTNLHKPQNYSGEELHRVGLANRHLETEPPDVPQFPIGTWCMAGSGALYQLRVVPVRRMKPREAEKPMLFVRKYMDWYRSGSPLPPVRLLETCSQNLNIADGHHRYQAAQYMGISHLMAWVAPARYIQKDYGIDTTDFTYEYAVHLAHQMKILLRDDVRHQYNLA